MQLLSTFSKRIMKEITYILTFLFITLTAYANPQLSKLSEVKPAAGSPAASAIIYLKAGSAGDVEKMKELTFGVAHKNLLTEETKVALLEKYSEIDWDKEVFWVEKAEGDTAKTAFKYKLKSSGRTKTSGIPMKKIDGIWKYGF